MGGDGARNDQINAGEIYVISGQQFLYNDRVYVDGQVVEFAPPTPTPAPTKTPHPDATAAPSGIGDLARGQANYEQTCAGCHGFNGEGVNGLGLPLVTSPLVLYATDADLLAFLRVGRPADHPDNTVGISMPESGGRPDWSDEELQHVIAYLRYLRDR
jgi:mono/diheme cytochrome c family protein